MIEVSKDAIPEIEVATQFIRDLKDEIFEIGEDYINSTQEFVVKKQAEDPSFLPKEVEAFFNERFLPELQFNYTDKDIPFLYCLIGLYESMMDMIWKKADEFNKLTLQKKIVEADFDVHGAQLYFIYLVADLFYELIRKINFAGGTLGYVAYHAIVVKRFACCATTAVLNSLADKVILCDGRNVN